MEQKPPVESSIIRKISAELEPTHLQVKFMHSFHNLSEKRKINLLKLSLRDQDFHDLYEAFGNVVLSESVIVEKTAVNIVSLVLKIFFFGNKGYQRILHAQRTQRLGDTF